MLWRRTRRILLQRPDGPAKRWAMHAPTAPREVRVVELRRETDDAVTLILEPTDGRPLPYRAGQYLTHCFEIDGIEERRAYSISSAEGEALACTIKVIPDGRVSGYVASRLRVGDRYRVLGPGGEFTLDNESRAPLALFAAGSGITPIVGLIETALSRAPDRPIRLVHLSRDAAHAIFRARLEALASTHAAFEYVPLLTSRDGRPDGAHIAQLLQPAADSELYLCGPLALMDALEKALRASRVPPAHIRRERFLPAARHLPRPTEPQEILFRRSERTITQKPGESILDAGLRAGLRLEFSCTVGGCGHCKLRVLDGQVRLDEPNCLTDHERQQGYTLACSACATTPITVDA